MALDSQISSEETNAGPEVPEGEMDLYLAMTIESRRRAIVALKAKYAGDINPFAHIGLLRTPRIFLNERSAPWYDVPYKEE